ncbi:MAG: TIGR03086 family protein [Nocardioidaceae bacterium]|nr:TIGR03086 family protein [Nocardioidaceae bacterium]
MSDTYNLGPAAQRLSALLAGLSDDHLSASTPCEGTSVGDMVDHVDSLSAAFIQSAGKEAGEATGPPPAPDGTRLSGDWRTSIADRLQTLAAAWDSPQAWEGMTQAGGRDMPGEVVGRVALDELVVHGWDIARASDQPYEPDERSVTGALEFVEGVRASEGDGPQEGLFAAVVPVPEDAPALDRLLGLTGRDPSWRPPAA